MVRWPLGQGAQLLGRLGPRNLLECCRLVIQGAAPSLTGSPPRRPGPSWSPPGCTDLQPEVPGSGAYALIMHLVGERVGMPVAERGSGTFSAALAATIRHAGGTIITGRRVHRIMVEGGRAVLGPGHEQGRLGSVLRAAARPTDAHPGPAVAGRPEPGAGRQAHSVGLHPNSTSPPTTQTLCLLVVVSRPCRVQHQDAASGMRGPSHRGGTVLHAATARATVCDGDPGALPGSSTGAGRVRNWLVDGRPVPTWQGAWSDGQATAA
jgi:hypothetical protein